MAATAPSPISATPIRWATSAPPPPANCSACRGKNIGDLLNAASVTWGFFTQGFDLTVTNPNGTTGCARSTTSHGHQHQEGRLHSAPRAVPVLHVAPPTRRTRGPSSVSTIGHYGDAANHQYDMHDFYDAVNAGNFPAVSFLKAPGYQDGHAGYSDPLDEQAFIVHVINFLQKPRPTGSTPRS